MYTILLKQKYGYKTEETNEDEEEERKTKDVKLKKLNFENKNKQWLIIKLCKQDCYQMN